MDWPMASWITALASVSRPKVRRTPSPPKPTLVTSGPSGVKGMVGRLDMAPPECLTEQQSCGHAFRGSDLYCYLYSFDMSVQA